VGSTMNGQLLYIFAVAILDAAILSWVALHWYRRTVSRRMRPENGETPARGADLRAGVQWSDAEGTGAEGVDAEGVDAEGAGAEVQVAVFRADDDSAAKASVRDWPAGWRRIAVGYCVGAALFSAVITTAVLSGMPSPPLSAIFGTWWINAWPVVPTLILLLLLDRRGALGVVVTYLLAGSAALAILTLLVQAYRWSFSSAPLTNMFWLTAGILLTAYLPLSLLLLSGWRRIRAVMPLALASTLCFGLGLLVFRHAIVAAFNAPASRDLLLDLAVMTSHQVAYYSLYMVLALPAGWLAWSLLKVLAASYERKKFSDVQLVVDCWWLIVTAETITVSLVTAYGLAGIGIGLAAFGAYRVGTFATLRLIPVRSAGTPKRLLLLRVFGHQARTESLFDRIAQRWRFRGPVQLIAGTDLAMRTADPGDMLAFVGGRLRDVYVTTSSDLPDRLARIDVRPDPDGRFRINELYCAARTWQETLGELLTLNDVVLMDLRGFTRNNAGCVFELERLVAQMSADSIVLVCDKTTDYKELSKLLAEAWRRAAGGASAPHGAALTLVTIERNSRAALDALMGRLLGRGEPHRVLTLSELAALA